MKLNETIGIPLGMITGLGIQAVVMSVKGTLDSVWVIGAVVMFIGSLLLWLVINRISVRQLRRRHKEVNHRGPVKRIPVFRRNSTNKRAI
jgi:sensor histidine kinase YesM